MMISSNTNANDSLSAIVSSLETIPDSEEVQVVKQLFDAITTGNQETFLELQTPAAIWEVDGNVAPIGPNTTQIVDLIPFAGTWYAPEGANLINRTTSDFFDNFQESLEIVKLEPLDFFQNDDRIVARVNLEAVVWETGLPFDLDMAYIIDLDKSEDGSVQIDNVRVKYHSLNVARAFSGLTPSSEVVDNAAIDPLTGEPQGSNPNADSEESLRVVQNAYADFLAGDLAKFSQAFADDGVFVVSSDPEFLPQSGVWQGPEGVVQALTSGFQRFTPTVFVPRFIANGDRVAVTSQQLGLSNENNFSFDTDGVQFLTVKDGLISSWQVLLNDYTSASAIAGEPLFLESEAEPSVITPESSLVEPEFVFDDTEDDILEADLDSKGDLGLVFTGAENPNAKIQTVEQMLAAIATGDQETFQELQTPTVIWEVDGNVAPIGPNTTQIVDLIPFAGTWYAPEGANLINQTTNNFFKNFQESLEILKLEPLDFFQDDDRVVARVNLEAVVEETGLPFEIDMAYVVDFENSEDSSAQIDSVQVIYNSLILAEAFAGQTASPEAADIAAEDPITGEPQSVDSSANTEESLQVVENAFMDFLAGDFDQFSQAFAEDAILSFRGDSNLVPQAGIWEGPEGIQQFFAAGFEAFVPTVFLPKFIANGDRVVVINNQGGIDTVNNFNFEFDSVNILTVRDGLITDYQILFDTYISASARAGEPLFLEGEFPASEPIPDDPDEPDLIVGSNKDDILETGLDIKGEQNLIFSGLGNDLVDTSQTSTGGNRLHGGTGLDELLAGKKDHLSGGTGDDILDASVGSGSNRLYGNEGNDELFAGRRDHLFAGEGDDILDATAGSGDNRLYGQNGNDIFFLGSGDRLLGGSGDDAFFVTDGGDNLITGGAGADAFWIATGELLTTANTITDFELDADVIGVASLGASSIDDLEFSQADDHTIISFSGFDLAVLLNTQLSDLQANETFVFA